MEIKNIRIVGEKISINYEDEQGVLHLWIADAKNIVKQSLLASYRVSAHSKCGSYFTSYLKSVIVVAGSKDEALKLVNEWCKENGFSFIRHPDIEMLGPSPVQGVLDYDYSSDY